MISLENIVSVGRSASQTIRNLPRNTLEGAKYLSDEIVDIPYKVQRGYDRVRSLTWEDWKGIGRKCRKELATSFVTTTAILVASNPIQVAADTFINEYLGLVADAANFTWLGLNNLMAMTDGKSWGGKQGMALMMYGGFGLAYSKLRAKSIKYFGIPPPRKLNGPDDRHTPEEIRDEVRLAKHDFWLTAAYSSAMLVAGYHIFGEHNWTKIACATITSCLTQPVRGPLVGYMMDVFKDLIGLQECHRPTYPQSVRRLGRLPKFGVALAGVAASLALMAGEYHLTPSEWDNPHRLAERIEDRKVHPRGFQYIVDKLESLADVKADHVVF